MFAIEQCYTSTTHPERNTTRVLKPYYKTRRHAEKRAAELCWVCKPDNQIIEQSSAKVVEV